VLDPFAGSNTTGAVAERLGRRWLAVEKDQHYAKDSELRFNEPEVIGAKERLLF
jgi:site-specific DNA-methyltransferase (cytosine-N4-specific)